MATWRITFLDGTTGKTKDWKVDGAPESFSTRTKVERWLALHMATRFEVFSVDEIKATRVGADWAFTCRVRDAFGIFAGCGIIERQRS
ncbi:MAG: hypothetical protein OEQ39_00205 [Gammaproteobacteria bacterium]|nr:hypothetical protein [Gammaproteobacteria bacterium]